MSFGNNDQTNFSQGLSEQPQKPRGWWSRNWKWFVPTMLLLMVLMCSGCLVSVALFFVNGLRHMEPYMVTMDKIQTNQQVVEAFGEPITDCSWTPTLTADGNGIDMRWDIKGPKGKGKAYVKSRVTNQKFDIVVIEIMPPDGKKIIIPVESGNSAPTYTPQNDNKESTPETKEPAPSDDPSLNISLPTEGEEKK
jgi:hypothetical protein